MKIFFRKLVRDINRASFVVNTYLPKLHSLAPPDIASDQLMSQPSILKGKKENLSNLLTNSTSRYFNLSRKTFPRSFDISLIDLFHEQPKRKFTAAYQCSNLFIFKKKIHRKARGIFSKLIATELANVSRVLF